MKTMPDLKKFALPGIALLAFFVLSPAVAAIDSTNLLDNALKHYSTAAGSWKKIIIHAASWLFWTLTLISMVWTFGMMVLRKSDIGELFAELIRFTIFTGFFWWLLVNGPDFATSIYSSFSRIAASATGLKQGLYPSDIVDMGFSIFYRSLTRLSVLSPVASLLGIVLSCIILVILSLIGVNMLLLLCSGWILAYAGIFLLGFGGSRWTSDIAINYYKAVLGTGIQIMGMTLIMGIGKTFLNDYYYQMSKGIEFKEMGVLLIVVVILYMLVNKIPPMLAGIVTGSGVGGTGIGNFGAGAAVAAMGVAATAMGMAARSMGSAAAASAGEGVSAIMTAFSRATGQENSGESMDTGNFGGDTGSSSDVGGDAGSSTGSSGTHESSSSGQQDKQQPGHNSGMFAKAGRTTSGAGVDLVKEASTMAKARKGSTRQNVTGRIADTTDGRIAAAIRAQGDTRTGLDAEAEIAAFRDGYPED